MFYRVLSLFAACGLLTGGILAQDSRKLPPIIPIGGATFENWIGLELTPDGATLKVPGVAAFKHPTGPRGYFRHGFRTESDSSMDWKPFYGVQWEAKLPDSREVELTVSIKSPGRNNAGTEVKSTVRLSRPGWHTVTLPWSAFQFDQARTSLLYFVNELTLTARYPDTKDAGLLTIRDVCLVKAPVVAIECAVRGKAGPKGQTVEYPVSVSNCTEQPQAIALSLVHYGWEAMEATLEPATLLLSPGETKPCLLRVKISDRIPSGGNETQVLQAIANGDTATAMKLSITTASELPHPYILHTPQRWQEVRDKVKAHSWAQDALEAFVTKAEAWQVPEVAEAPGNDPNDNSGPYLFRTQIENDLLACGYSWQLTGNKQHAEKIAEFLRRLSSPVNGYPVTWRACNQSEVQEGHFFQHIAMAYDMILDADVLSQADREQIETTLRLFTSIMDWVNAGGSINNWNLSEVTGAFYCALAMQDLVTAERFFSGPGGIKDQLGKGTMDDGWWYECSIGYNMWCASEFTQVALAYQPFGVNFKDMWVPASYSPHVLLVSELNGGNQPNVSDPEERRKPFGMNPDVFGPVRRPYRTITDLWNGLIPFLDYRGVIFGVNDSTESKVAGNRTEVGGQPFEIAYYAYRDPAFAAIIKLGGGKRDLLYGVPELPEKTPERFRESAFADNVGLAMLRSQTEGRPIREQIQATLHYGTHGWAHGHFDRTDLLSLMRYGRNFWNPESVFYVYEPFMYKFYTQTSLNHNMVVVDQKMQEATPGERLLFHTGKVMQATAVEATARWSNPPYGGMIYDYVPVKTFAEKTWREGRHVPIPEDAPAYGTLTGYTEPVLQRRLMIVTDDYIVLADYVKGTQPHTFDNLLQIKGFKGIEARQKKLMRHDAQWNPDPIGSAQFVTDCDWYSVVAPAVSRFEERWGPGEDEAGSRSSGNEAGVLKLDVHTVWPVSQEIMIATAPEQHDVEKRLFYTIRGDNKVLADGKFGAWILGQAQIDLPVEGINRLELETKVEISKKPTAFWANARIVTKSGQKIPLDDWPAKFENIQQPKERNMDYFGAPIKIVGIEYPFGIPAQPQDSEQRGLVSVDLSGRDAVRFTATLGSDYPPGPEAQRRKIQAVRTQGTETNYLTVIEPYETLPLVKTAIAESADKIRVELKDGRVQELTIMNLKGTGKDISVSIVESKGGKVIRSESTQ